MLKYLGKLVDVDPRIAHSDFVKLSIRMAFSDPNVLIRLRVLELLDQWMNRFRVLRLNSFELLGIAIKDVGLSVRRMALELLHKYCIEFVFTALALKRCFRDINFPKRTEACVLVLSRWQETDDRHQAKLREVFTKLWFTENRSNDSNLNSVPFSKEDSASSFKTIVSFTKETLNDGDFLNSLLSLLRSILDSDKERNFAVSLLDLEIASERVLSFLGGATIDFSDHRAMGGFRFGSITFRKRFVVVRSLLGRFSDFDACSRSLQSSVLSQTLSLLDTSRKRIQPGILCVSFGDFEHSAATLGIPFDEKCDF